MVWPTFLLEHLVRLYYSLHETRWTESHWLKLFLDIQIKVSVLPKIDHILKKLFFTFSDISYSDLSFRKTIWIKIESRQVINKRLFFALITYLIAVNGLQRVVNLHEKLAWQVAAYVRFLDELNCFECSALLNCWRKLRYVVEETQKLVSICKADDSTMVATKGHGREKIRFQKNSIRM